MDYHESFKIVGLLFDRFIANKCRNQVFQVTKSIAQSASDFSEKLFFEAGIFGGGGWMTHYSDTAFILNISTSYSDAISRGVV